MFGEYEHTIDGKGRMFLPSKFRLELGEKVYLTRSVDKCVCIYPVEEWKKFIAKLDELPPIRARDVKRSLCASASETDVDGQGRVLIPQQLRDLAGLQKSVVVIGVGEKAEIWDVDAYEEYKKSMDAAALEADLIALGL